MKGISKEIFECIVRAGMDMIMIQNAQLPLVVASLSRINGLDPKQALRLKERLISLCR